MLPCHQQLPSASSLYQRAILAEDANNTPYDDRVATRESGVRNSPLDLGQLYSDFVLRFLSLQELRTLMNRGRGVYHAVEIEFSKRDRSVNRR